MIEATLTKLIEAHLPGARVEAVTLPQSRGLRLYLLNEDYPQHELGSEAVLALMNNPLYWIFCWASGRVLARRLLDRPEQVRGRRVLDFGCGSGVVAIAAARAGAARVIACDSDPQALVATAANARLNGVELELAADFNRVRSELDLIIVADVLYDRANLPWLARFLERAPEVLVADSRISDFHYPPYREIARARSCTLPDLDESEEHRTVRIYRGRRSAESRSTLPRAR